MPQVPIPPAKHDKFVDSMVCTYFVSVVSAWVAELVTYPCDLTKTRLQIQGELANKIDVKIVKAPPRGMVKTAIGIVKEEGIFKLWQGIPAQFLRHAIYSGTRIVAYKTFREHLVKNDKTNYFPLWKSALCGISAGSFAQFISNPADLMKVQLQMEGKRKLLGLPPRVLSLADAFKKIVSQSGYLGLWRGAVPNVQRAALVNLGDLTTYDSAKQFLIRNTSLEDGVAVHVISSFCAGFVAACMGTPADTIKTRIMNQPTDSNGRMSLYKGTWDCCKKTVQNEGFAALYKGFLPNWLRMAPWSLTFWLMYENTNHMLGVDRF